MMVQHRWEAVGLPDQSRRGRRSWYLIRSLYYTMAVTMLAGCGFTDLVGPHDEDDKDSDPVSVVTERLPVARVGVEYEKQLSAEGGQGGYTWSIVEGAAPEGMELTDRGVIHGTPVNLGDATFTVRAESEDGLTADRSFTLSVEEAPSRVTVVTEELPDATLGEPYRAALAADGGDGTWTWFVLDGGLPEGLSLSDGGVIEGTPTAGGEFTFLVKARAGTGQYGTRELTLRVVDDPVVVTTETLPSGTLGVPYQAQLEAEGAGGAYDWAIVEGALPAGLSLNADGVIQGIPSQSGESDFWVRAAASDGQADERRLEISITALPVVINAASLPLGQVGVDYDVALTAQGGDGAFVWSLSEGSLPVGLAISDDGVITGLPEQAETSVFTVRVESGDGQVAEREFSIEIEELGLTIYTEADLPGAVEGEIYTLFLDWDGGEAPWTWSMVSGSIPNDLFLTPWGVIQGVAEDPGTHVFTLRVESGDGQSAERTFTLVIAPAP